MQHPKLLILAPLLACLASGPVAAQWGTQDRVTQDRVTQDRVAQDRVAQDRVTQDKVAQDRRAQDEDRKQDPERGRKGRGEKREQDSEAARKAPDARRARDDQKPIQGGQIQANEIQERARAGRAKLLAENRAKRRAQKRAEIIGELTTRVRTHRIHRAELDRLEAIFKARGDDDRVQRVQTLRTGEQAAYVRALDRYQELLGDDVFASFRERVRLDDGR